MPDEERSKILIEAAKERYTALHTIRSRVEKTCTWTLGSMLLVTGWLVQRPERLGHAEAVFLLAALLVVTVVIRGVYLKDLERGFRAQQLVLVKIEEKLGLFDDIYPERWKSAGLGNGGGHFFRSIYSLLYLGASILAVTVLLGALGVLGGEVRG